MNNTNMNIQENVSQSTPSSPLRPFMRDVKFSSMRLSNILRKKELGKDFEKRSNATMQKRLDLKSPTLGHMSILENSTKFDSANNPYQSCW